MAITYLTWLVGLVGNRTMATVEKKPATISSRLFDQT